MSNIAALFLVGDQADSPAFSVVPDPAPLQRKKYTGVVVTSIVQAPFDRFQVVGLLFEHGEPVTEPFLHAHVNAGAVAVVVYQEPEPVKPKSNLVVVPAGSVPEVPS